MQTQIIGRALEVEQMLEQMRGSAGLVFWVVIGQIVVDYGRMLLYRRTWRRICFCGSRADDGYRDVGKED